MDIKLPEMNGIEVAQNIRETDNSNIATPIVLVTAAALQSTIEQAKKAGINELLTKPYTPNQLVSILKKYLITDEEEEEKADEDTANMEGFKFNPVLDVAYLNKLYAADGQSAIGLFQVFLDCMSEDWQLLQEAIQKKDWQRLKGLVHKLKPNFSMVGLTNLTKMMQVAYEDLQQGNVDHALEQLAHIQKEMDRNSPLVEKELERMQDFYKQEVI
jgi:CheY-like chemotaxis protein